MLTLKRLDSSDATRILAGAKAKAEEIGIAMCIAITDESCNLLAFLRMDGSKIPSITLAIDKSYTASGTRKPTHDLAEPSMPGKPVYGLTSTIGGRMVVIAGGLPIFTGDDVIGAIGVSSGTPAQDLAVAEAGVQAFGK
ncbi:heme-binding protein [Planktotalea sp.]|uniref:GlcG/HbpS family heme-binding protein n=1 Tax=Planktotalea sp. TaxID=2029877 RepID=UPI0025FC551B|nr:heme-binding protein [Planktotalea sp.]